MFENLKKGANTVVSGQLKRGISKEDRQDAQLVLISILLLIFTLVFQMAGSGSDLGINLFNVSFFLLLFMLLSSRFLFQSAGYIRQIEYTAVKVQFLLMLFFLLAFVVFSITTTQKYGEHFSDWNAPSFHLVVFLFYIIIAFQVMVIGFSALLWLVDALYPVKKKKSRKNRRKK
ncbi:MAG: hypothetical protein WC506_03490 [Candidatus Micrarchaeia archaeon]